MARKAIIDKLKKKHPELDIGTLKLVLETFEKSLIESLVSGHKVELRSFGSFFTRKIAEKRNARNPRTGEKIYVPEKIKLKFKASKELKKLINKTNA